MTSKFDAEIASSALDMLDVFGVDCFVNGLQLKAIFNDDEFEDETGQRRDLSLEVLSNSADNFTQGDSVFVGGRCFEISKDPVKTTDDPFIILELKRA